MIIGVLVKTGAEAIRNALILNTIYAFKSFEPIFDASVCSLLVKTGAKNCIRFWLIHINSPAKQLKEESMNRNFRKRFEEELEKIKKSLETKNGTKNYTKVIERVGRAREKYPSIAKYYVIDYIPDNEKNPKNMAAIINWRIAMYGTAKGANDTGEN